MSHELTQRSNGFTEMAFTGPRSAIWHGLGQELPEGQSIEEWMKAAGMDWEVKGSPALYNFTEKEDLLHLRAVEGQQVLFRSDNGGYLGTVGERFQVVQPKEVLEFFRDLTQFNGMKLSTAGTLFGGKRFWALAETGHESEVTAGDKVKGHLLLTTSCEGTMATTAKYVCTRVVCNNTMTIALNASSHRPVVRITHKKKFDEKDVKLQLGLADKTWDAFIGNLRKLADTKMSIEETRLFFAKQFYNPNEFEEDQKWSDVRLVNRLSALAVAGSGSSMSTGTAWGALCGVTEYFTHGTGKRNPSHQFWDSYVGDDDTQKSSLFRELLQIA